MAHTYGRASALKTVRNVGTWNLEFVENSFRNLSKFENEILIKKKKRKGMSFFKFGFCRYRKKD